MRRRGDAFNGSLDLLLDTICNAFGGIVFIALLLAILTQNIPDSDSGMYQDGTVPPSVLKLRGDLRMLEEETARLENQVKEQEKPENTDPLSEIDQEFINLRAKILSLEQITHSSADEISRIEKEILDAKNEIENGRKEIAKLAAEMTERKKENTEVRRLPVSQPSPPDMRQYWVFVQKGRLHLVSSFERGPGYYPDVVILEDADDHTTVTVREEQGQILQTGSERFGKLKTFFDNTSPNQVVVQVMLDTASFKEFNFLKDQLINKGYRYFFDIGELPVQFVQGSDFENF